MQVFRLLTKCDNEDVNDKYAGRVAKDFESHITKIELTFISDSLGTTFFVKKKADMHIPAHYYVRAIDYLNALVNVAYGTCKIVDDLRLV